MFPRNLKFKRRDEEQELIDVHDLLMSEYGWIPLEEFKKLPIPTTFGLLNSMKRRYEREKKQMKIPRRKK